MFSKREQNFEIIFSHQSTAEIREKARSLILLVERLKRPFHTVKSLPVSSEEKVEFFTAEKETESGPTINLEPRIPESSGSLAERLDRIEAKIDSFQQRRRPSIVQAVNFSQERIERPIAEEELKRIESNEGSGYESEDDKSQPKNSGQKISFLDLLFQYYIINNNFLDIYQSNMMKIFYDKSHMTLFISILFITIFDI